ncbi:MAG TPA: hypothetical protein VMV44_15810 [Rectinemataceae bacterium]|nr:hypothetical protein [Rectinemataceae bacterium]
MPIRVYELKLPLDHDAEALPKALATALSCRRDEILEWTIRREAVDARRKSALHFSYTVDVSLRNEARVLGGKTSVKLAAVPDDSYKPAKPGSERLEGRPVVVGTGPAGLFAGLALAKAGYRPLLVERGKSVDERTADVERFWREGILDPESNAQFGEGGAGTFSDGKLTTLINDPRCSQVLREFVEAGAPPSIIASGRPHLGTDALRGIVKRIRGIITGLGGEFRFSTLLSGLGTSEGRLAWIEVRDANGGAAERLRRGTLVLAIGHSADDSFAMLRDAGLAMLPKPFAVGLRIEHPQVLVDSAQYGSFAGHPRLGAAEYKLAWHGEGGRSAFTFCMCPGGQVVAAASREGCLVTNGMSYASRDGRNANSALLVNVTPADFPGSDLLSGFDFQRQWEGLAFAMGGGDYRAPAQLLGDYRKNRVSTALGGVEASYQPGIRFANLREALPPYVGETIVAAIPDFGRRIQGFDRDDALLTGVETRSSSPVRIPRGEDFQSSIGGLYPVGEGAGYAGGIMSAAVDGLRVAEAIIGRFAPPS